jgi:hypothetical protein
MRNKETELLKIFSSAEIPRFFLFLPELLTTVSNNLNHTAWVFPAKKKIW